MVAFFFDPAAPLQVVSGNSTIMVCLWLLGRATTKCTSWSSSMVARRSATWIL